MHETLTHLARIIQFMEDERRTRDSFASVHTLLADLTAAVRAGRWPAARQAAGALHELFGAFEEGGQPGLDTLLFPGTSLEGHLAGALEALGYPAESAERLRALGRAPEAGSEEAHREALRAELVAFAKRTADRDSLLLASLGAGISEAETARLSRIARNTVRSVRSRASDGPAVPQDSAAVELPEPVPGQRRPPVPPVLFLAPGQLPTGKPSPAAAV